MSSAYTKKQLEDIIAGLNTKLDTMQKSLTALEGLPSKVTGLENLLKEANEKNAELVKSIDSMDKDIVALRLKVNG